MSIAFPRARACAALVAALLLGGVSGLAHGAGEAADEDGPLLNPALPAMTGSLVVVCRLSSSVCIVDLADQEVRTVIATDQGPHEVAVSPDGRTAVVSIYGGGSAGQKVLVIDVESGSVTGSIDLGKPSRPHGFAWLEGSRVLVTTELHKSVVELCVNEKRVVRELATEGEVSHMVGVSAQAKRAFTTNIKDGTVSAIDLTTGALAGKAPAGVNPEGMAVTPDGAEVWVADRKENRVHVLDARTLESLGTIDVGLVPFRVAITPDGKLALVTCPEDNQVFVIDRATRTVAAKADNFEGIRRLNEGAAQGPQHPVPAGLAVLPDGRAAFVANVNSHAVSVLDLATRTIVGTLSVGAGPDGLAWSPVRCRKVMEAGAPAGQAGGGGAT